MTLRAKRRYTGPTAETVLIVGCRAGWLCEICESWDDCQVHHRRPRAMGGSRREDTNSPANLLLLCADCHRNTESRRGEALNNGWLVRQADSPAQIAVLVDNGSRWVYLTSTGEYSDNPPDKENPE